MVSDVWKTRSRFERARAALTWGVLGFALLQLGLSVLIDGWQLRLCDPEYASKLSNLKARLAEKNHRPLVIALGSSRTALGFRPDTLAAGWPVAGESPLVFNLGVLGAGPVMELVCLERLLAEGIHPDLLIVEIMPPHLHQWEHWREENWLDISRFTWRDVRLLRSYYLETKKLYYIWSLSRLAPWYAHRFEICSQVAPSWVSSERRQDRWFRAVDRLGWTGHHAFVDPVTYERNLEKMRQEYIPAFYHFEISDVAQRALHDLLDLCRREQIAPILLLMPEATGFASWYSPEARRQIDAYLVRLTNEYGVAVIDARTWVGDVGFIDGHHLVASGATVFTERLGRTMLDVRVCPLGTERGCSQRK